MDSATFFLHDCKGISRYSIYSRQDGGCSGKRPDWYHDYITAVLGLEFDENQHCNYTCENKRIVEHFFIVKINPDSYIDKNDNQHHSCFDKSGKLDEQEWNSRMSIVKCALTMIYDPQAI